MSKNPVTAATRSNDAPILIPFSELVRSGKNVRKTRKAKGVEALALSIKAQGLLQNIVIVERKDGTRTVEAGDRRIQAIGLLIQQGKLGADYQVPCKVVPEDQATAVSLAENVMREAMHPADEFEAFAKLKAEGRSIDFIADAFGVTPLVVERRLKLATAAPALIEAFRNDELNTEQVIALCATDDHERQIEVWNHSKNHHWMVEPAQLRRAVLGDGEIDVSKEPRIAFIGGLDAYREAGGNVRTDLFTGDGTGGFITDLALLEKLVADKLEAEAEALRGEGWGWVAVWPAMDWQEYHRLGRAPKSSDALPAEVLAKIEALEAESNALRDEEQAMDDQEDEYTEAQSERLDVIWERQQAIELEIDALRDAHSVYGDDVKANAGAVVTLDDGKLVIHRGMVKAEDRKAVVKALGAAGEVAGGRESKAAGRKPDALSDALTRSLLGHRNLAAQIETAQKPDVAKVLLACWVVQSIRNSVSRGYDRERAPCNLAITAGYGTRTMHPISDEAGKAVEQAFDETCAKAVADLPKADGPLWEALAAMKAAELDKLIAYGVARSVSLEANNNGLTGHFIAALGLDMASHFTATADNYLGRVPKQLVVTALQEAGKIDGKEKKEALLAMKKRDLATAAETQLAGTGWVPALLRGPKPKKAAPVKAKPKAAKKPAAKTASKPKAKASPRVKAA